MNGSRNSFAYRRSILENIIEKPPFSYEKSIASECESTDADRNGNVVNINLGRNCCESSSRKNTSSLNGRCHTTINFFINDHHSVSRDRKYCQESRAGSKMMDKILLGKNIPDHKMMKNLLGNLGIKKFLSAPNMNTNNTKKMVEENLLDSTANSTINTAEMNLNTLKENNNGCENNMTFLYVSSKNPYDDFKRRNIDEIIEENEEQNPTRDTNFRGSFKRKNIEKIIEENEDDEPIKEMIDCPAHHCDHLAWKKMETSMVKMEPAIKNCEPIDPLKRFKKKPFRVPSSSKQSEVLFRESSLLSRLQLEKVSQPKRIVPSFRVRTQMFYRKKGRDSMDEIEKRQSNLILNGKNKYPICSSESHGPYDEYKKNLISCRDGTLCCKNLDYPDDEAWSKAETRNIVTSEFIKEKIRRFDKFAKRKNSGREQCCNIDKLMINQSKKNYMRISVEDPEKEQNIKQEICLRNLSNEELGSISLPKETRNAMTRMLLENSKSNFGNGCSRQLPKGLRLKENERVSKLGTRVGSRLTSEANLDHLITLADKNNKCWPGVAERVRPRPEENMP
ncbi:hypothetical protein HHI36_014963 [Cryptolaemus montrouzieri]|uniref:Uncharacterized protein n=1 Tax=Cryptolaemus montrouzieri TaxID=559131 RepID=A0ABD2N467_9CUCU